MFYGAEFEWIHVIEDIADKLIYDVLCERVMWILPFLPETFTQWRFAVEPASLMLGQP